MNYQRIIILTLTFICATSCSGERAHLSATNAAATDVDSPAGAAARIGVIVEYSDVLKLRAASDLTESDRHGRAKTIADKVHARYAAMRSLAFQAVGLEPPSKSFCVKCRMTRDSLHSEVYLGERISGEPIFVASMLKGTYIEKSRFGGAWQTLDYSATFASGTGSYKLLEPGSPGAEYWCTLGLYGCTWLGPGTRDHSISVFDSFTYERLMNGEFLGETRIGDVPCSVVVWESDPTGERTFEVFYVAGASLLIGMDQFVSDGNEPVRLQRRRRFNHIEATD